MPHITRPSHSGSVQRVRKPTKPNKPIGNATAAARFAHQFSSAKSCSLRQPEVRPDLSRASDHRTTNHVSFAPLISLVGMALIAMPKGIASTNAPASLSGSFNRGKNCALTQPGDLRCAPTRRSTEHSETAHNRPAQKKLFKEAPAVNAKATVTPPSIASTTDCIKSPAPIPKSQRSFLSDSRNMLQHRPAATYLNDEKISGSWGFPAVDSQSWLHDSRWLSTASRFRAQSWQKSRAAVREKIIRFEQRNPAPEAFIYKIQFNPLTQDFNAYISEYLKVLFQHYDVDIALIDDGISADFADTRHMYAASAILQPTQTQPIIHSLHWSIKEVATGVNAYDVEKFAGPERAVMGPLSYHWPPAFPPGLKKDLTEGALWDTLGEFMAKRLTSGPLVTDAKANMRAYIIGLVAKEYRGDPETGQAHLDVLLKKSRGVIYRGHTIAGLILAPPTHAAGYGVLYSTNNDFSPIEVTNPQYPLNTVGLRNAVIRGLPLKTIAELGDALFFPLLKGRSLPHLLGPYIEFTDVGKPEKILWQASIKKFFSDMDFNVLSSSEKKIIFALGLAQTAGRALMAMLAPVIGPGALLTSGLVIAIPDAVLSRIVDKPETAEAHLYNFFLGIAIEAIGMSAFLAHRSIIMLRCAKAVRNLKSSPATKDAEANQLLEDILLSAEPSRVMLLGSRELAKAAKEVKIKLTDSAPDATTETPLIKISLNTLWEEPSEERKIVIVLIELLAEMQDISDDAAAELFDHYHTVLFDALNNPGVITRTEAWRMLPEIMQRIIMVKYTLEDRIDTPRRAESMAIGRMVFEQPLRPCLVDRFYFYAREKAMRARLRHPGSNRYSSEYPSEELRARLSLDSTARVNAYLDDLQAHSTANDSLLFQEIRSYPSSVLNRQLSRYADERINIFFEDYQEKNLPEPAVFTDAALYHEFLQKQFTGQEWHYAGQCTIDAISDDFKRRLSFEQALPHLAAAVLKVLHYTPERMALSGSHGQKLRDLRWRAEVRDIPGFSVLNRQEAIAVFDYVQGMTGLSARYPLGTLQASVDKMLTLFPHGNGLSDAKDRENDATMFAQVVALDLAIYNGVRKVDAAWAHQFWEAVFIQRASTPGLAQWIDNLTQRYPNEKMDRVIAATRSLREIAKALPPLKVTSELIAFAKNIVRNKFGTDEIGGDSPYTSAKSNSAYLATQRNNATEPESIQAWAEWLQTQPTDTSELGRSRWVKAPNPLAIQATRVNAMQMLGWQYDGMQVLQVEDIAADTWAWRARIGSPDKRFLPDGGILVMSGAKNFTCMLNNVAFAVKRIENRVTTIFEIDNVPYDDNFCGDATQVFAQMLAKNNVDGSLYSTWPDDVPLEQIDIGGLRADKIPCIQQLSGILRFLNDFSPRNGSKIFDDIFHLKEVDVAESACHPRALFDTLYKGSPWFRSITHAAQSYVGTWTIIYGQKPSVDLSSNFLFMPKDSQIPDMRKDGNLANTLQPTSLARLYTQQWLNIFLQRDAPDDGKQHPPSLTLLLTNIILDQCALMTYERWTDYQQATTLTLQQRIFNFNHMLWLSQYVNMQFAKIAPNNNSEENFMLSAADRLTIAPLLTLSASLPEVKFGDPIGLSITVEGTDNNFQHQQDIKRIHTDLQVNNPLCTHLMRRYQQRISHPAQWRYIFLSPSEADNTLSPFSAGHHVDAATHTVYLTNLAQRRVFYASDRGLMQTDYLREATIIWMKIMLDIPNLTDKEARNHRGIAVALTDIRLLELHHSAPPAVSSATINAENQHLSTQMLDQLLQVRRNYYDEEALINKSKQ